MTRLIIYNFEYCINDIPDKSLDLYKSFDALYYIILYNNSLTTFLILSPILFSIYQLSLNDIFYHFNDINYYLYEDDLQT